MKRTAQVTPGFSLPTAIKDAAADWLARRDAGFSAGHARDFREWCAADPQHAAAVAQLESTWGSLDRPLQGGAAGEVLRELDGLARRRRQRNIAAAGAVALCVLMGIAWQVRTKVMQPAVPVTAVVLQPARQTLPDGSVVELKEGAKIEVNFGPALRRVVLLQGEAHFAVAKNKAWPFVVHAGGVEVRAVGTAFSVDLGKSAVEVLVTEGRVAVGAETEGKPGDRDAANLPSESPTLVDAGHGLLVALPTADTVPQMQPVPPAEVAEKLAWRVPRLEFSGTPLRDVVALFNQHNQVQFRLEDETLGSEEVSGLFRADRVDAFVHALETGFPIKAERRSDSLIILRRAP